MKIVSAEFVASAASPAQYPRRPLPEVAFAGRSNVGKSSLINTLVHRKSLVKTSATPGKTRTLNFFVVNERFSFVDFPGYGYARVPREMQAGWRPMVEAYLKRRDLLRAVVHIVDFRHPPSALDCQLRAWLPAPAGRRADRCHEDRQDQAQPAAPCTSGPFAAASSCRRRNR